jgi:hypothetical protein
VFKPKAEQRNAEFVQPHDCSGMDARVHVLATNRNMSL